MKTLIRKRINANGLDSVSARRNELQSGKRDIHLLEKLNVLWNNMDSVRRQRARGNRFVFGDQWSDPITIIQDGEKKTVTMREYLSMDGQIPLQTNQLKAMVNTIVGVLVKEQNEPVCNAIDRDEQVFGEVTTKGLQANCNKNRLNSIMKLCVEDLLIGGIAIAKEIYGYRENEQRRLDSWTYYVDPNYVILDTTMRDPLFRDMTLIGVWYRMSFSQLCAKFVKKPGDYERLKNIYPAGASIMSSSSSVDIEDMNNLDHLEFMQGIRPDECCVAEVWTLETKERLRVHDWNEGTLDYIDADDSETIRQIDLINRERRDIALQQGMSEQEIPYIETEAFIDTYWYCRFLAPDGSILWEEESPYADRMHPFSIMVTPFIDGRIVPFINDGIEHNIAINRALVLQDWIVRNQVKGFTMIPQQLVPDHMSNEEFVRNGISIGNYFFYDADKARGLKPEVFHAGAISYDASNYINTLKGLMESSTSVSGAIQGKIPYSGTSAALYAQQTSNSSTPIASLLQDIRIFLENVAIKKAKNIIKFYDADRWVKIAGSINGLIDTTKLNLNEIENIEFDISIKESAETPVYRAIANDYLINFFNAGAIDLQTLLECGNFPFGDSLLQKLQARQAEAEQISEMQQQEGMATHEAPPAENPVKTQGYGLPVKSTRAIVK